ncbi:acetaldehyde dehydrogenase (acetylating) [Conexibacter stalactiti]|uniref:Acetaldehyde dehydrogenase n=1 Tax=Conexibacter stalactiti TaxID=1940611 RepID=A0ABU4HL54_9ACTN|nr:acetaldehyde dehydrogenase (acetylating) [Conexibacter stalactiti]MDW5594048.1 acetaldehyde dehydrogenase (acetylating) [Conexibacter stalactiti]MEC5034690.1 acetaldehyde dehydrogenase (acetylating) [Conexibacter stalactiti]
MSARVPCAVLGSGNIGTDLLVKLGRSELLEPAAMVGIDPASDGLARARAAGIETSADGIDFILANPDKAQIVFDATSAGAHRAHAPLLAEAGLRSIDLTPAKLGPGVVPVVNLDDHLDAPDLNMITCGGQATIPIVAAVAAVCDVPYAEMVSAISSRSAGPGTRASIDEFTRTTARGLEEIGGAARGKAIIVLNPAEPPIVMRNTVFCELPEDADEAAIARSVLAMRERIAEYVPGYRLRAEPIFDPGRVTIAIEVESAGDYLPAYAGNLDIMTAAGVRVGERLARRLTPREVAA